MNNDLLYRALMMGRNKKTAEEEYLSATGQKDPVSFYVLEYEVLLKDIFRDSRFMVHICIEGEGYLEIAVSSDDSFLIPGKNYVTTDESKDGETEVSFTVLAERLHNGKNYGSVSFKTSVQEINLPVIVDNKISTRISDENPRRVPIKITKDYLSFRMGHILKEEWQARAFLSLSSINGNSPRDLFLMLYKAHVYVIYGDSEDPENILEYAAAQLEKRTDYSAELFSYYLYVKSLYEKDEAMTAAALRSVREFYEAKPSWQLLWIMFYLDEEYPENPQKKLDDIRELFLKGKCNSPVMYFEAWEILRDNSDLATGDINFLLQIFAFAIKNDIFTAGPALLPAERLYKMGKDELMNISIPLALFVLKAAFEKYPVSLLSNTIARLLIFSNNKDKVNHTYFERAVFDFADIPLLYNYYLLTLDEDITRIIPERIIKYFTQGMNFPAENRDYFYANIITNRYESHVYKTAYEECVKNIYDYGSSMAIKGKNSASLAVIYGHLLETFSDDIDLKRDLYRISFVKKVTCKNERMKRVLVFYEEFSTYTETMLEDGCALISIYSPGCIILFKDAAGNLYKNIEYELESFEDEKEYAKACIKDVPLMPIMFMGESLSVTMQVKGPSEILNFLLSGFRKNEFTKEYDRALLKNFLEYYKDEPVTEEAYNLLMAFLKEDTGEEARALLLELMIKKRHYPEAADEIRVNGFKNLSYSALLELTHVLVQTAAEDDTDFVLYLCVGCLKAGIADNDIIRYMCRFYDGETEVLIELYKESKERNIENLRIAQKILQSLMQTGAEPEILPEVLSRCYEESQDRDQVQSFLEHSAGMYLYGADQKYTDFFDYIGRDLLKNIKYSDTAKTAFLLYMRKNVRPEFKNVLSSVLNELVNKGIMFEEFKDYKNSFTLPPVLLNTHIAKYITGDSKIPNIKYVITGRGYKKEGECPMETALFGIYVKYFTLLFGESLTYRMDEEKKTTVSFSDIIPENDGSRFSLANEISRITFSGNENELSDSLKEYYIKDELIRRLF